MKIEVSDGEILDKLSILQIKLKKIEDICKLKNIKKEFNILYKATTKIKSKLSEDQLIELELLYRQLEESNSILWNIEDNIRYREEISLFDEEFVKIARSVYITNDVRSEIKRKINNLTKSSLVEEKSYHNYGKIN